MYTFRIFLREGGRGCCYCCCCCCAATGVVVVVKFRILPQVQFSVSKTELSFKPLNLMIGTCTITRVSAHLQPKLIVIKPTSDRQRWCLPLTDKNGGVQLVSLGAVPWFLGDFGATGLIAHLLAEPGHHMLTHQLELGRQDTQNVHFELPCTALHSLRLRTAILHRELNEDFGLKRTDQSTNLKQCLKIAFWHKLNACIWQS